MNGQVERTRRLVTWLLLAGCLWWPATNRLHAQESSPPVRHDGTSSPPTTPRSIWTGLAANGLRTLDGSVLEAQELAGRWILLDFWATWCAPCIAELPTLRAVHERYPPDRLLLLGVSMNRTTRATVKAWLQRQEVNWLQIHDGQGFGGRLASALGVDALPRTVLIDPDGRVVAVDLRGDELLGTLEVLVGDR